MHFTSNKLLFVHSGVAHERQISEYINSVALRMGLPNDHRVRVVKDYNGFYRNHAFVYIHDTKLVETLIAENESCILIPDEKQNAYIRLNTESRKKASLSLRFEYAKVDIKEHHRYDLHVLRVSGMRPCSSEKQIQDRIEKLSELFKFFSSVGSVKVKCKLGDDSAYIFFPIHSHDAIFARNCLQYNPFEGDTLQIYIAYTFCPPGSTLSNDDKKQDRFSHENSLASYWNNSLNAFQTKLNIPDKIKEGRYIIPMLRKAHLQIL
jgi:hypothetical protein